MTDPLLPTPSKPFATPSEALQSIQAAQSLPLPSPKAVLRQCVLARRAFAPLKNHPIVLEALGNALHDLGYYARAAAHFERVVQQFPASSRAHYNVGRSLLSAQKLNPSNDWFARAELLEPDYPMMLLGKGFIQLATQSYEQGWQLYEHRLRADGFVPRVVNNVALWAGQADQPIAGKTIFVANEQGLGDTLMFFRYVIALVQLGARVTVLVQPRLQTWVSRAASAMGDAGSKGGKIVAVVSDGDAVQKTDYWCPMPSLPVKLSAWKMLAPAYLPVSPVALPQAKQGVLKVGLAWSGEAQNRRNAHRSFEFLHIAALLQTPNVQFFNLQMGDALAQAKKHPLWGSVVDLTPLQTGFYETAQHIAALDLVITVDTSILHAAGTLGQPFWALLDSGAEWRNGTPNQSVHPFYPKGKLYRAPRRGFKAATVARMARDLAQLAADFVKKSIAKTTPAQAPSPAKQPLHTGSRLSLAACKHGIFASQKHDTFVGRSLALYGQVLEGEVELCKALLPAGGVLVEVGAGIGAHSVPLARHVHQGGRVVCFEAQCSQFALLQTNATLNELENMTLHLALVGASAGSVVIPQFDPLQQRNCGVLNLNAAALRSETVPQLAIDSVELDALNLLKIDAAGMELSILQGAAQQLHQFKPWVYLCNPARTPGAASGGAAPALDVNWLPFLVSKDYRVFAHRVPLFAANNHAGQMGNVFGDKVSTNFLAVPRATNVLPDLIKQYGLIELKR